MRSMPATFLYTFQIQPIHFSPALPEIDKKTAETFYTFHDFYTFHVSREQASPTRELTRHGLSWRKPRKPRSCILDPRQFLFSYYQPSSSSRAAKICESEGNRGCRGYARINTN